MAKNTAAIKAKAGTVTLEKDQVQVKTVKEPVEVKEETNDGSIKTTTNEFQQMSKDGTMPRKKGNWVKMNSKQVEAHQEDHTLIGHDPKTGEGLLPDGMSVIDIKEE